MLSGLPIKWVLRKIFLLKVMTAASYWSLLAPAIETASQSNIYGKDGQYAFIPVSIGFLLGAAFVYYADVLMTYLVSWRTHILHQFLY
jgi:zinc transporter 11